MINSLFLGNRSGESLNSRPIYNLMILLFSINFVCPGRGVDWSLSRPDLCHGERSWSWSSSLPTQTSISPLPGFLGRRGATQVTEWMIVNRRSQFKKINYLLDELSSLDDWILGWSTIKANKKKKTCHHLGAPDRLESRNGICVTDPNIVGTKCWW